MFEKVLLKEKFNFLIKINSIKSIQTVTPCAEDRIIIAVISFFGLNTKNYNYSASHNLITFV